nr:hypothetical protein [Tanacetum cinerariifolium]
KLLDDLKNIHEELAEYINTLGWNRHAFFDDDDDDDVDYTIAITPVLSTEKPDNTLNNSTPSSEFLTKSSSTFPKSVLKETNTFDDSLHEFENFCFDLEEISSGSTTTHSDISLSEYDSFIFDLLNDQCPPTDRSDFTHEEFADELAHIISPPKYGCFYFRDFLDPGEWISSLNSETRENLSSTTCVNLPVEDDHSPLWRMLYGSFLLISRISLFLFIFTHSEMKIPSLTHASPLIVFIRLSRVYLIGVELSRNLILTVVT